MHRDRRNSSSSHREGRKRLRNERRARDRSRSREPENHKREPRSKGRDQHFELLPYSANPNELFWLQDLNKSNDVGAILNTLQYVLIKYLNLSKNLDSNTSRNQLKDSSNLVFKKFLEYALNAIQRKIFEKNIVRYITTAIHRYGKLSDALYRKRDRGIINSDHLSSILLALYSSEKAGTQGLSTVIYGVGLMAKSVMLSKHLFPKIISLLLKQLCSQEDINSKSISMVVYGVSFIIEGRVLEVPLDSKLVTQLLDRLCTYLFSQLVSRQRIIAAKEISNTFHGVSIMAKYGALKGSLNSGVITELLSLLGRCRDINISYIGKVLHHVGLIAQYSGLDDGVNKGVVEMLLTRMLDLQAIRHQHIASFIGAAYGAGLLAESGALFGRLDDEIVTRVLTVILESENQHQDSNSEPKELGNRNLMQLARAMLYLGRECELQLLEAALASIKPMPNSFQKKLKTALDEAGIKSELEALVVGVFYVDMLLNEYKTIVEFDGPGHLNRRLHIKDRIRDEYLERRGYKIMRFRNYESDPISYIVQSIQSAITELDSNSINFDDSPPNPNRLMAPTRSRSNSNVQPNRAKPVSSLPEMSVF